MYEKQIYNPGFVQHFQKPWYRTDGRCNIRYYGQFSVPNRDEIHFTFEPLLALVQQVEDSELRERIRDMIEEMKDAHDQLIDDYRDSLPSAD